MRLLYLTKKIGKAGTFPRAIFFVYAAAPIWPFAGKQKWGLKF